MERSGRIIVNQGRTLVKNRSQEGHRRKKNFREKNFPKFFFPVVKKCVSFLSTVARNKVFPTPETFKIFVTLKTRGRKKYWKKILQTRRSKIFSSWCCVVSNSSFQVLLKNFFQDNENIIFLKWQKNLGPSEDIKLEKQLFQFFGKFFIFFAKARSDEWIGSKYDHWENWIINQGYWLILASICPECVSIILRRSKTKEGFII